MRVTGVALFVLALAHFSILHFIWDPAEQTADFIATERWNQIFWRCFDWLLLMTVLFHGFLGVRTVIDLRNQRADQVDRQREHDRGGLLAADLSQGLQVAQLHRGGLGGEQPGGGGELLGGLELGF